MRISIAKGLMCSHNFIIIINFIVTSLDKRMLFCSSLYKRFHRRLSSSHKNVSLLLIVRSLCTCLAYIDSILLLSLFKLIIFINWYKIVIIFFCWSFIRRILFLLRWLSRLNCRRSHINHVVILYYGTRNHSRSRS